MEWPLGIVCGAVVLSVGYLLGRFHRIYQQIKKESRHP